MDRASLPAAAVLGLFVGLGLAVAGAEVGSAIAKSRTQRYVTVRGLAEREVDADLAIWPIAFKETAAELTPVQRQIDAKSALVAAYLERFGFKREDLSLGVPRIADLKSESPKEPVGNGMRYVAEAVVTVRSKDVARVKKAMSEAGALVSQGVMLVQDWESRPQFLFQGLNAIKPEMIEQATLAAREAASKFAKDSGSQVGGIRTASQGLFEVSDRDSSWPERKVVRVVTTMEYFLVD